VTVIVLEDNSVESVGIAMPTTKIMIVDTYETLLVSNQSTMIVESPVLSTVVVE
jgi:hypothetical protein